MHHLRKITTRCVLVTLGLLAPCVSGTVPAQAGPELQKTLAALAKESDPAVRLGLVKRLQAISSEGAAEALARIVQKDPSGLVRAGAARALGFIDSENALDLLLQALTDGGPRAVREALAVAIRRRKGGPQALLARLLETRRGALDRGLMLRALAHLDDDPSKRVLLAHARSQDVTLMGEAVQALALRKDAAAERAVLWKHLLMAGSSMDELLPVLDVAETSLTPALEPALRRTATFLEPAIQESALWLLELLRHQRAQSAPPPRKEEAKDRYGNGGEVPDEEPPPPKPPARARLDFVYVLDATGSTNATLPELRKRILDEMELLVRAGVSVRVGCVAYRGGRTELDRARRFQVLPLGYDASRVRAFLMEMDSGGVDDRGAAVAHGLDEALARMNWRWNAQRTVQLFADSRCEDARFARLTVGVHFQADRTRTRVTYVLRTRTKMPPEYEELARLGGTGAPELLK